MTVIVAGGSGFVGRQVVETLTARGHEVVVLARGTREAPPAVEVIPCDLVSGTLPLERLRGADALVNLVGIKRERGTQTFEAVHVGVTGTLIEAARALGVERFVHVSVVCSRPDPTSGYHDTKWRAEEIVRASGLAATILRPAVIYGRGDDMVSHLVRMIRFAPLFPVVGRGDSILQPVDVRDVAEAVAASLERPHTIGRSYEIAGPARLTLGEVVRTVAQGMGLRVAIVPTPLGLQRLAVRAMSVLMQDPLSTPAQLRMLAEGLYGDREPACRDLGLEPRPFTAAAVRELEAPLPALFGFSLRLVESRGHAEWLAERGASLAPSLAFAVLAVAILPLLSLVVSNVWYRMAASYVALAPVALLGLDLGWKELLRPSPRRIGLGALAAAALYLAGAVVAPLSASAPAFAAQVTTVYGWKAAVPAGVVPLLLPFIIAGEEVVRNAITLPLAGRFGGWAGVLLAGLVFAAAHVSLGVELLVLAALGAGLFWSALIVKAQSAVPAFVCHLLWDLAVLFWLPYTAGRS